MQGSRRGYGQGTFHGANAISFGKPFGTFFQTIDVDADLAGHRHQDESPVGITPPLTSDMLCCITSNLCAPPNIRYVFMHNMCMPSSTFESQLSIQLSSSHLKIRFWLQAISAEPYSGCPDIMVFRQLHIIRCFRTFKRLNPTAVLGCVTSIDA